MEDKEIPGIEESMRIALDIIEKGQWAEATAYMKPERIPTILGNMLRWFEEREEYEACAKIHALMEDVNK